MKRNIKEEVQIELTMLRTIFFVLFLFVDLSCCDRTTDNGKVTEPTVDTQISTTTDKEELLNTLSMTVDDTSDFDLRLTSQESTETTPSTSYFDEIYANNSDTVCEIKDFDHISHSNSIEVKWNDCGDRYSVNLTKAVFDDKEIPHFRTFKNRSEYTLERLEECTAYNISIKSDSGDEYPTTIRTLPGEVQDLRAYVHNNVTYVNWSLAESQDCRTYNLLVDNETMSQVKSNSLQIRYNLARCTTIEVTAADTYNNTGSRSTITVPGEVLDFVPVFNEANITLNWSPPDDISCVAGYFTQLDDQIPIELNASTTTYTYDGLEACTSYSVAVAAFSDTGSGEYLTVGDQTATPATIAVVESFTLTVFNDTLRASWSPPSSQSACITGYSIVMWADSSTTQDDTTTDTYYDFTPTVPCKTYNVMVKAMIGLNEGHSITEVTEIAAAATDAPTLRSLGESKTSCTINLQLELYRSNMCTITMVIVNCTAQGNEPHDWIVDESNVEYSHTDSSSSRRVSILVDDLSEYTNYVCYAYVINIGGESEKSAGIEFRTLEGVPSAPQDLKYTIDGEEISITWTAPHKIPGVLGNYKIAIEGVGPVHHIPEDCVVTATEVNEETDELRFRFSNYLPNYVYNVSVVASTGAGFGEAATIALTTPAGASDAPREVNHKFEVEFGTTYNATLTVNWKSPCNTNGELIRYGWHLEGESLEGGDDVANVTGTVEANANVSDLLYELSIPNIQVIMSYTFTLAAYTEGDIRGEEYKFTDYSPDGYPSAPQNIKVEDILATAANISWEGPLITNGEILSYLLTIRTTGPIHYIPEGCDIKYSETYEYPLSSTTFSYVFEEAMPHFRYTVSVSAKTSTGNGFEETMEFTTLQAEPEPPRNVNYHLENVLGETYNATLHVEWLLPCNTNGNLSYFMWVLEATSLETSKSLRETDFTSPNEPVDDTNYGLIITNLLPMCNYTLVLTAFVGAGYIEGSEYRIEFRSPEGYSSPPKHLKIEDLTATTGNLTWKEPLHANGEIQSYRIVVTTDGPLHYIPAKNCNFKYDAIVANDTLAATALHFPFAGYPNFKYRVGISAINGAGHGFESAINFTTLSAQSTAVREVNYELNSIQGETYNVTLYVDWLLPCNTNGNLTNFTWTLESTSLESNDSFMQTGVIEPNEPLDDVNYGMKIMSLMSMSRYVLTIAATVDDGRIKGEEYKIEFESPEGYSSPPLNLRVEDLTESTGTIFWEEPSDKNGVLQFYRIVITTDGPLHYIPSDCNFKYEEIIYNETLAATTLHFLFRGYPNFKYRVAVSAVNGAGHGFESAINFTTLSAQPEIPRYVSHYTNRTDETDNVSVTINWLLPCNTNGELNNFVWILTGHSLESDDLHNDLNKIDANEPLNTTHYEATLQLRPYYSYTVSIAASVGGDEDILGEKMIVTFVSPDGYPSVPYSLTLRDVSGYSGSVSWEEPSPKNGEIQTYRVIVRSQGSLYEAPTGCILDNVDDEIVELTSTNLTYFIEARPNFKYSVSVAAATRAGYGPEGSIEFSTLLVDPEAVSNIHAILTDNKLEDYTASVIISFETTCNLHGEFSHYVANIIGKRDSFNNHSVTQSIADYETNQITIPLTPQFTYNGQIEIHTKSGHKSASPIDEFKAPAGVPSASTAPIQPPEVRTTNATFALSDDIFDNSSGDIQYYAIIINVGNDISAEIGGTFEFWNSSSWPEAGFWSDTVEEHEYQVTPKFWNPFTVGSNVNYTIGESNCSNDNDVFCNGPLRPNTQYAMRIRGFTLAAYRDTQLVYFKTSYERSYLALILGVVFGTLAAILVLIFIFILWRRRKKEPVDIKEPHVVVETTKPPPIPKSRFAEHCDMFENNRNELKAEYSHLDRLSAAEKPSSHVAMADNNKKKNRYVNIMAYDDTRVKLAIDNNDNYEDYINASYIRGYSGNHEYIATQGPMESTLEDFWRMIIQEEVGLIVMVAQCVEQSKQKCYKYFPEKEQTITIGKSDIYVKCTSEADMTDYVIRNLIVEKDDEQMMIKHLQFMLWPDFGCPTTTHSMLEFRDIMRRHIEVTKTKAVIHCSAGVGRTGTLIAIDILLQKIDNSNDAIDVFGGVLDLRRQRTHMVQTEKQYEYIHKCLRDYLIKPKRVSNGGEDFDPIYENVAIINGYSDMEKRHHENNVSTENLIRLKEL